jgi:CP family cyanate transporter-like MFS transporter
MRSRVHSGSTPATLGGLLFVALALRPQIIALGPLVPAIRVDLAISHAVTGLLSAIPILCMGIFAPLGPVLARAFGPKRAIALGILAITCFGVLRASVPGVPGVVLTTFGIGIGMGAVGPILPMVVRLQLPGRPMLGTGAYATGILLGSAASAALALPLATAFGGWRAALAILSIAGLASVIAWLVLTPSDGPGSDAPLRLLRLPWGQPTVWVLGVAFALQSTLYYGSTAWLVNIYVERGWSEAAAAGLLTTFNVVGLVATVSAPLVAERFGTRREQLACAAAFSLLGLVGIAVAPGLAFVWAAVLAVGTGTFFPLILMLPVDVADRASDVGAAAALMLLVGYVLASAAPVVLGFARDATGDFGASVWVLVMIAAILIAVSWTLSPTRLRGREGTRVDAAPDGSRRPGA